MATFIHPSFTLRGVNPDDVQKRYASGEYQKMPEARPNVKIAQNTSILKESISKNENDGVYSINVMRGSEKHVCARSSYKDFQEFNQGFLEVKGICTHCGRQATMCYPTVMREIPVLVKDENGVDKTTIVYAFWGEGRACSFQGALWIARRKRSLPIVTCQLIHLLYSFVYPNGPPLTEGNDPELCEDNNGPIPYEKWAEGNLTFRKTSRVILAPINTEYVLV